MQYHTALFYITLSLKEIMESKKGHAYNVNKQIGLFILGFAIFGAFVFILTFSSAQNETNNTATNLTNGSSINASTIIVVGRNAASGDMQVAQDIANFLGGNATSGGNNTGVNGTGDVFRFQRASDNLNLGESLNTIQPSSLDNDDLPNLLRDAIFIDDNNEEFDYSQFIDLGSGMRLEWFEDSEFNEDNPMIGIRVERGAPILNYTLDFDEKPSSEVSGGRLIDFEQSDIEILGRTYTISSASNSTNTYELLGGAVTDTLRVGDSKTYNIGNRSYDVEVSFVDQDSARLQINGVRTNDLEEGDTYNFGEDTQIGVKEIDYQDYAGGIQQVTFIIGAERISLIDGDNVEINDESVDDLVAHITKSAASGGEIQLDRIVIEWIPDEDAFLTSGRNLVMPGFGGLQFLMQNFTTPTSENTTIESSGDDTITLSANVEDGMYNDLAILSGDGTTFTMIGESNDNLLATSNTNTLTFDTDIHEVMVASWASTNDAESYVLEVTRIGESRGQTEVTVRNAVTNEEETENVGGTIDFGNVVLTVTNISDPDNTATFSINSGGSFNNIYTREGLTIFLPVNGTGFRGAINLGSATTYPILFEEENEDEDIGDGQLFNVTVGWSGNEAGVSGTGSIEGNFSGRGFIELENSDVFVAYLQSALATRIEVDTGSEPDTARIEYHGSESYADIYIASGNATNVTVPGRMEDISIITDDNLNNLGNSNLIVIGGSCVNRLSAQLLNVNFPTCGQAFTTATTVGAGQYIIQGFNSPFGNARATLIAGYEASDTRSAGTYFINQGGQMSSNQRYVGSSSTSGNVSNTSFTNSSNSSTA